jgi:hypothetical protein
MIAWDTIETKGTDNGVVHPAHPPVIETAVLADRTKPYQAGTVVKYSTTGGTVEPAGDSDTPVAVLTENADGKNAAVLALWHGTVVRGRLIDASATTPVTASDTLAGNLRAAGIYPIQLFTSAKKG